MHRLNNCPGYNYIVHYWQNPEVQGEVYSATNLLLLDMVATIFVPDITDEAKLEDAIARREGRMSLDEFDSKLTEYLGADVMKGFKPLNWGIHPISAYANVDKEWPEPEKSSFKKARFLQRMESAI